MDDAPTDRTDDDPMDRTWYELMRAKHTMLPLSTVRKSRLCGYVLLLAAFAGPVVATLPAPVRETYVAGDPLRTPLGAAAVALFGVVCLTIAGVGLAGLALHVRRGSEPDESRVWTLIGVEDALSGIGFVTGFLGVATGVGILASGHAGVDGVEWLLATGIDPYLGVRTAVATPLVTSLAALAGAIATLALAHTAAR